MNSFQADFVNLLVDGGVIGRGSVEEQLRFLKCPELLLARLFSEKMTDNECIIVTGI